MLKATGIVRRVDELGRIVVPKELRRTFGINEGDPVEVFVSNDGIVLKKYTPGCFTCNQIKPLTTVLFDKPMCRDCIEQVINAKDKILASFDHE